MRELHAALVVGCHMQPKTAWVATLTEARRYLKAARQCLVIASGVQALSLLGSLTGDEGASQALEQFVKGDEPPPTIEEQFGAEVAAEAKALEEKQREFLKRRNIT